MSMKRSFPIAAFAALLLLLSACSDALNETPIASDEGPDLPAVNYNYSQMDFPAHFFAPDEPGSVISMDNTPADNPVTDAGATLGRVLFYDKHLSANRTVSCGSCHQQEAGFSDPRMLSVGFDGGLTGRHSMGLSNARFYQNGRFFWDERAATLEEQVLGPIQDPVEMGMTLQEMVQRIEEEDYYPALFQEAFGDEEVSSERVSKALAQFVRSMATYRSRYDEGRAAVNSDREDFPNFTAVENRGKALFVLSRAEGGFGCASCHVGASQVGMQAHNIGLDRQNDDVGAFSVYGTTESEGAFKVPSLRNIALTAPYMHDGRFDNLMEVMGHYSRGIQPNPSLSAILTTDGVTGGRPVQLNIDREESTALIAFLETLTDEEFIRDERYSDPFASSNQ